MASEKALRSTEPSLPTTVIIKLINHLHWLFPILWNFLSQDLLLGKTQAPKVKALGKIHRTDKRN
jgi:hypothetical protein